MDWLVNRATYRLSGHEADNEAFHSMPEDYIALRWQILAFGVNSVNTLVDGNIHVSAISHTVIIMLSVEASFV